MYKLNSDHQSLDVYDEIRSVLSTGNLIVHPIWLSAFIADYEVISLVDKTREARLKMV